MSVPDLYYAKVVEDSVTEYGERLTSIEVRYPHAVHKDMLTHCVLERNFLSFRAYPPEEVIRMVEEDGFEPEIFYGRAKGMAQGPPLSGSQEALARAFWQDAKIQAVNSAKMLNSIGVDKGTINVLLQDFCWITGIISATEWDNFFALRAFAPEGSKPRKEVEKIARLMYDARKASEPRYLQVGQWHLPYVSDRERMWADEEPEDEAEVEYFKKVSVGRTARISYLTHDGKRDPDKDVALCDSLITNGHMSPLAHVATPLYKTDPWNIVWDPIKHGKFRGFRQFRKEIPSEDNFAKVSGIDFHERTTA
jgi:hypothetical protein